MEEGAVDFIGEDVEILFFGEVYEVLELFAGQDSTGGILGVVYDD